MSLLLLFNQTSQLLVSPLDTAPGDTPSLRVQLHDRETLGILVGEQETLLVGVGDQSTLAILQGDRQTLFERVRPPWSP